MVEPAQTVAKELGRAGANHPDCAWPSLANGLANDQEWLGVRRSASHKYPLGASRRARFRIEMRAASTVRPTISPRFMRSAGNRPG